MCVCVRVCVCVCRLLNESPILASAARAECVCVCVVFFVLPDVSLRVCAVCCNALQCVGIYVAGLCDERILTFKGDSVVCCSVLQCVAVRRYICFRAL